MPMKEASTSTFFVTTFLSVGPLQGLSTSLPTPGSTPGLHTPGHGLVQILEITLTATLYLQILALPAALSLSFPKRNDFSHWGLQHQLCSPFTNITNLKQKQSSHSPPVPFCLPPSRGAGTDPCKTTLAGELLSGHFEKFATLCKLFLLEVVQ